MNTRKTQECRQRIGVKCFCLALAALCPAIGSAQTLNLTTEYIRGGGRTLAVLHQPSPYFTDVTSALANEANLLYADGVSAGCGGGQYCPYNILTRDQMAVLIISSIYTAINGPGQGGNFSYSQTPYFSDVPTTYWAFKFIQKMYELGITAGCGNGDYCPTSNTLNYQMAVFSTSARLCVLYGVANGCGGHSLTGLYPTTPQYYQDVPSGSTGFAQIQYLTSLGVITPTNCTPSCYYFDPNSAITRGVSTPYLTRGILDDFSY
jgi:hypothetical protein